ncbi:MAG: hypothetical protein ACJAZM_002942 [Cyclobacteriaceae bacterium]|jgi:hypothetical protein
MKEVFVIILTFTGFLLLESCGRELDLPVPHYMYERFSGNQPCSEVDYIRLHLPDSTLFIADTMPNTRFADGWGDNEMSHYVTLQDSIRTSIRFYDTSPIDYRYRFAVPGSYRFYDSHGSYEEQQKSAGVQLNLFLNVIDPKWVLSVPSSAFFHINGSHGDDYEMTICGEFDFLLVGQDTIPVSGDYSLTYTDYFF